MRIVSALAMALLIAAPLAAQDSGAVVGASIGVTDVDSRGELTFAGSAGYRFNRYVGLEIEVTAVPTLKGSTTNVTSATSALSALPGTVILPAAFTNPN